MATIRRFDDLDIWKKARELNQKVLPVLSILEETKNFELKSQLDGSLGSVMDNIAEGFERDGNREFIQFLAMAKGSLGEARSQFFRVFDRSLMGEPEFQLWQTECLDLAAQIANFIKYLQNSEHKGIKFR